MTVDRTLQQRLCLAAGPSGEERAVAAILDEAFSAQGLRTEGDRAGNRWVRMPGRKHRAPSAAVLAHMDEVGLVVRRVRPDGFLQMVRLGGIGRRSLATRRVRLPGRDGPVPGLLGVRSHHLTDPAEAQRLPAIDEAYVDIGAADAEGVRTLGVDVGTTAAFEVGFDVLAERRVTSKALDDRACCAVLETLDRRLASDPAPGGVHLAATVREEFDLHGALRAGRQIRPQECIVLDVTPAGDTPELQGHHDVLLGAGPVLTLYDFHGRGPLAGYLAPPEGFELVEQAAAAQDIPLQRAALLGLLSDAAELSALPDPPLLLCLSLPLRYTHSPVETCDMDDLDRLAGLVDAVLRALPQQWAA